MTEPLEINYHAHVSDENLKKTFQFIKKQMFERDMTDNQYHISGRYKQDCLWRDKIKAELERRGIDVKSIQDYYVERQANSISGL